MARTPQRVPTSDEVNIELAKRALRMKRSGMNLFEIAEVLQMSEMRCNTAIKQGLALAQATIGYAERRELLAMEVDRLDALQFSLWDQALAGDVRCVEAVLKVINQRSRLLGLEQADTGTSSTTVVVAGNHEMYVAALEQAAKGRELEAGDA